MDGDEMEVRQVDDVWKVRCCCTSLAAEAGEEEDVVVVDGDLAGVRTCVWRRVLTTSA